MDVFQMLCFRWIFQISLSSRNSGDWAYLNTLQLRGTVRVRKWDWLVPNTEKSHVSLHKGSFLGAS